MRIVLFGLLLAACSGGRIVLGTNAAADDLAMNSVEPDLASDLAEPPSAMLDLRKPPTMTDAKPGGDLTTPPGACPADTVAFSAYCMDRYEAPNEEGTLPFYFQTAPDGEAWCGARGKRLCTEAEWVSACEGPSGFEYPYGNTYVAHACNDDKTWKSPSWATLGTYPAPAAQAEADRLYQGDPSGSRTMCLSDAGVADLTGNVAEWVKRSFPHAKNYDYVVKGCYWSGCYMDTTPDCHFVNSAHPPGFRSYEFGFRCCMDKP